MKKKYKKEIGYSSLYASNFASPIANNKDLLACLSQTDLTAEFLLWEKLTQLASAELHRNFSQI